MLHDSESIAHFKFSNIVIWMTMAFQGGYFNMTGFMACHHFVSHVTGYGTLIPYTLREQGVLDASLLAIVPLFFLLGAMVSGYLVDVRLKQHKRPKYYISFGFIFFITGLLFVLGEKKFFGTFGEPLFSWRDYFLLATLAFICGVQNGIITTVSKAVIRTTHLSGITTDLGIGLSRMLFKRKLEDQVNEEGRANLMRIGIIAFFLIGSFAAYEIFTRIKFHGFILPFTTSGVLFFTMLHYSMFSSKNELSKKSTKNLR